MNIWISFLEVVERAAVVGGKPRGAFTNGLALAGTSREAEVQLRELVDQLGWRVVQITDTDEFDFRCANYKVDQELKDLAAIAASTRIAQVGSFYTWLNDGEPI